MYVRAFGNHQGKLGAELWSHLDGAGQHIIAIALPSH
jgi:hypothetical protein